MEDRCRTASWEPRALSTSFDLCLLSMCRRSTCARKRPQLRHLAPMVPGPGARRYPTTSSSDSISGDADTVQSGESSLSMPKGQHPLEVLRAVPIFLIHWDDGHAVRLLPLAKLL